MARAYCLRCDVRFNALAGETARCPDCNETDEVTVRPVPGVADHAAEV